MYTKFGKVRDAWRVFDEIPLKDALSYKSLLLGFGQSGFHEQVLLSFERMRHCGFSANDASVAQALMASVELGCLEKGVSIHDLVLKTRRQSTIVWNSLLLMYVNVGRLDLARQVFDGMLNRDIVSWNSMIMCYSRNMDWVHAFGIFASMKVKNIIPNHVTFLGLVMACGQAGDLVLGQSIHGHLICLGELGDLRVGTSVVDMYCKCGKVDYARSLFEHDLFERSLVSWNSLIAGCSQNGCYYEAIELFRAMLAESNVDPDVITMANLVPSYAGLMDLRMTQSIHGFMIKGDIHLCEDVVIGTAMVDAYGKSLDIKAASFLFSFIEKPNSASWNALISGYNQNGLASGSMELFLKMLDMDAKPDSVTLITLLQSCGSARSLQRGLLIHNYCHKSGFGTHITVSNAVIDMYMSCGSTESAEDLFNLMPIKNIVTWNTMLCGYARNGLPMVALEFFHMMQTENLHRPDAVTIISIVQASASLSSRGDIMHGLVLKMGLSADKLVANSLLDAYSKNGSVDKALSLFEQMGNARDQSSWNVMISGCGINGRGLEAIALFHRMEEEGQRPNSVTFVSLLSSCSHSGLVSTGCGYFDLMCKNYGIRPGLEHFTCMIDMFGRAGRLKEAFLLVEKMPKELVSSDVWGALLSACRLSMNLELGELVGRKLLNLAPDNCGYYATFANAYASEGRWNEATRIRRVFEDGCLMKKPGWSVVV